MFRRHPLKWLVTAAVVGICIWLRFRTVPILPGDHLKMGLESLTAKEFSSAERHFRNELRLVPEQPVASEQLALLLIRSGRSWEASPCVRTFLKQDRIREDYLIKITGDPDQLIDESLLNDWQRQSPEDLSPLIGLARIAFRSGRTDEAQELLDRILALSPNDLEAHVIKGQAELATTMSRLPDWNSKLPKDAEYHPGIWFVRGDWCQQAGDPEMAARCFLEAIRLNPHDRNLNLRLGQLLGEVDGRPFLEHADTLRKMYDAVTYVDKQNSYSQVWGLIESLHSLGRFREAAHWGQNAMTTDVRLMMRITKDREFADKYRRIMAAAHTVDDLHPGLKFQLKKFPDWHPPRGASASQEIAANSKFRFRNDAAFSGLDFTYFNADDPATEGKRLQETSGGGVGVLDVDHDGWPDLYFPQGCTWPPGTDGHFEDQLFRNLRGHSFSNSTVLAGFGDTGFGQSVTVADFDNDGFDDLYLGNIGLNRLYQGNGDGTFTETTTVARMVSEDWTSSCAPGDFNGDSLTDLYVANYIHGQHLFEIICENKNIKVACSPSNFESTQDCLLINLGDGRFEDQSTGSGIQVPHGPGLGVVAALIDSDDRLDIFVANDQQPNFCFLNQSVPRSAQAHFREYAVNNGLAFDRDGKSQACMGVAVGHINSDEGLDLFVTNFANESNTLYLSQSNGIFSDATAHSGLAKPSYPMLGFGTAFLDADLDNRLDLVVANGHIGDHRHFGQQYRMRPQFFANIGTRSAPGFAELSASDLGSYFESELLGRGLALLDWNRDGRPDFCVSHLDSPAALLTNETTDVGHFLAIRLCGVQSSRDAIGTRIRVVADGVASFFQLTGGGSYLSSSERFVLCGLGDAARIDELRIQWPSGTTQTFQNPDTDQSLVAIEGRSSLIHDDVR